MRVFLLLLVAVIGCASPDDGEVAVAPDPVTEPAPPAEPALEVAYACESGQTVRASYPTDSTAVVVYDGQTRPMTIAVSGSGARYVGEAFEWWTQGSGSGSEGTVFRHNPDGTSGDLVETCEQG